VSVSDRDGKFIYDLSKDDFQVFDNGVEQKVAYFATTEKPFTVVLLIDTSTSIWNKLGEIKEAAVEFLDQLRPDDQVMIASFSSRLRIICPPTSNRQTLRSAIRYVDRGSSTQLYDAMDRVMNGELNRFSGRKAVVLFTDGVDSTSAHATYQSNVQDAEELDGLIYPIRYDTYDDMAYSGGIPGGFPPSSSAGGILGSILRGVLIPGGVGGGRRSGGSWPGGAGGGSTRAEYENGKNYLYDLAAKTGGRVYEASEERRSMDLAFRNIAEELRRQYSLGYYPKEQAQVGEQRHIKVKVRRSGVAVRARDSYIYNSNGSRQNQSTTADDSRGSQSPPVLRHPFKLSSEL
jgi:VWFA-related protein